MPARACSRGIAASSEGCRIFRHAPSCGVVPCVCCGRTHACIHDTPTLQAHVTRTHLCSSSVLALAADPLRTLYRSRPRSLPPPRMSHRVAGRMPHSVSTDIAPRALSILVGTDTSHHMHDVLQTCFSVDSIMWSVVCMSALHALSILMMSRPELQSLGDATPDGLPALHAHSEF